MKELLIGIDWSWGHYDVCILAPNGAILSQFRIARTTTGLEQLQKKINKFEISPNSCLVGIETAHDILVDFLLSCQYQVYVIAPSIVNSSRGRFGSSGAHSDKTDARLIAELLRTDQARFAPWRPDSTILTQIKVRMSHIDSLTKTIIQHNNRLRSILLRVYPQPLTAFSKLTLSITLNFLVTYPTPTALDQVSYAEFAGFCRRHHCNRPGWIKNWFEGLHQPAPTAAAAVVQAYQPEISFLARLLLTLLEEKKEAINTVQTLCDQHPDHAIFASLPGIGKVLLPKFLVMFGEDRQRFPTPQSIRQLAGTCPVTKQSGKKRQVVFRKACNHAYRDAVQQHAVASVRKADWAWAYYLAARKRGHHKNDAFRRLANRWLGIIWKLWQTHQLYDESYHLKQIHKQRQVEPVI